MEAAVADAFKRLIRPSIETEQLAAAKEKADDEAIRVFAENLRQLLLSPPLGVNLFIAQNLSGISFERVAKGAFPYMMLIICFIIMLILWQDLPLWLPRLTGQY